jgi:hypothetical protein
VIREKGCSEVEAARSSQVTNVESIREENSYPVGKGRGVLSWVWCITIRLVVENAKEMELKPLRPHRKLHLPFGVDNTCSFRPELRMNDARLGTRRSPKAASPVSPSLLSSHKAAKPRPRRWNW